MEWYEHEDDEENHVENLRAITHDFFFKPISFTNQSTFTFLHIYQVTSSFWIQAHTDMRERERRDFNATPRNPWIAVVVVLNPSLFPMFMSMLSLLSSINTQLLILLRSLSASLYVHFVKFDFVIVYFYLSLSLAKRKSWACLPFLTLSLTSSFPAFSVGLLSSKNLLGVK